MSAGGGQGNWGPWPVNPRSQSAVLPGEVKIDAVDANPGFIGAKIVAPPGSGLIVAPNAGPPETLQIKAIFPDKMVLPYYWNSSGGPFSSWGNSYIFTSSSTQYDTASIGEYPTPLDFIADKIFLAVNITSNTTNPFGAPPAAFSIQPTRKGVVIPGVSLTFDNGFFGYRTNETTLVGALGDTFGLQLFGDNMALAPTAQDIEFCATLYILGHGTSV